MNSLQEIEQLISVCTNCRLHQGRTNTVPGMGNPHAKIMFIGEAPGKDEDLEGKPFVGRSGKLLTTLLEKIGIDRQDVFIANIVKCRPPENRDPQEDEIEACWAYLEAQIDNINPRIIVTLGRHSLKKFLPGVSISAVHGEPKRRQSDGRIIFPLYHPAVALYKASMLDILEKDMQKLKVVLQKIEEGTIQYTQKNETISRFSTEISSKKQNENLKLF